MGKEKPECPNLTEAQLSAIYAPLEKPLLILASAGSGKTLVLCHRILFLVSKPNLQGISAKDILALTFTRRAGQDLLQKLRHLLSSQHYLCEGIDFDVNDIRVGTFHSFCLSVLRAFPEYAGLSPNFVVFTPKMQLDLLENVVEDWYAQRKTQSLHGKSFQSKLGDSNNYKKESLLTSGNEKSFIKAKAFKFLQDLRNVQLLKANNDTTNTELDGRNDNVFSKWVLQNYQKCIDEANGIDFNSFVRCTLTTLKKCPTVLESAGFRPQYIFVDEFQDTDIDQLELLRNLGKDGHITVVGDDDQQIYSWRGANGLHNIKMFENIFSGAVTLKLEQNFRSTGAIVAASRCLINKNKRRMPKTIRTASQTGAIMTVCECRNVQCEATVIVDFIESLKSQGVPLREVAILYRLQYVGMDIKRYLQDWGIECHVRGGGPGSVGNHSFVKGINGMDTGIGDVVDEILAVLRLATCQSDEASTMLLLKLFCPCMNSAIRDCFVYLKLKKRWPLLQAIKATRSHLLGLLVCDDLSTYSPSKSISVMAGDTRVALEGMHSMLKLVSATKNDLKYMGLRDVTFNILQQISYARGDRNIIGSLKDMNDNKTSFSKQHPTFKSLDHLYHDKLCYAGVKSLLKEASLFDAEIEASLTKGSTATLNEKVILQGSYLDMKHNKRRRNSISFDSKVHDRTEFNSLEKLKGFLDRVTLKMHTNELGDNNTLTVNSQGKYQADSSAFQSGVTLSTIHQAKGLEWSAVILVRANEGTIPVSDSGFEYDIPSSSTPYSSKYPFNPLFRDSRDEIEEERRLMYVALTRAKRFILVTYVINEDGQIVAPSRFLAEIPRGLICKNSCYESKLSDATLLSAETRPSPCPRNSTCLKKEKVKSFTRASYSEVQNQKPFSDSHNHTSKEASSNTGEGNAGSSSFMGRSSVSGISVKKKRSTLVLSSDEED